MGNVVFDRKSFDTHMPESQEVLWAWPTDSLIHKSSPKQNRATEPGCLNSASYISSNFWPDMKRSEVIPELDGICVGGFRGLQIPD